MMQKGLKMDDLYDVLQEIDAHGSYSNVCCSVMRDSKLHRILIEAQGKLEEGNPELEKENAELQEENKIYLEALENARMTINEALSD